jgi:WD40 repeat protein
LGADKEDAGRLDNMGTNTARFNNHFHNPLKTWDNAGLDDWILVFPFQVQGKSSLLWAQDSAYQSDLNLLGSAKWPEGDWTWEKTRENFYTALTAQNENDRQEFFARTFRGLGHQVHLLEDKVVPAHVRNDAHPLPWHIEKWLADNPHVIRCLMEDHQEFDAFTLEACMEKDENGEVLLDNNGNPVLKYPQVDIFFPGVLSLDMNTLTLDTSFTSYYDNDRPLEKIALLTDTDQYQVEDSPSTSYSIGLAEYTNGNFFSGDTVFTENYQSSHRHYFPNPNKAMTNLADLQDNNILPKLVVSEDKISDGVICVKKNPPGEEVDCLVRAGYLTNLVDGKDYATYELTFILDAPSHESYVKHLIPRAVGYAAALIDYFFRGRLDLQVGGITYGEDSSITGAQFRVRNVTPSQLPGQAVEPMENGELDLVCGFIPADGDTKEYHLVESVYSILNAGDPVNSEHISMATPLNIPAGARDISFTLVFRGKLGDEADAVAAQVFTFNNSRIAYYHQPGGQPETSNIFTSAPDGSDPYQVTDAAYPNPWYFAPAWSKDGTVMAFERERCTDPNPPPDGMICSAEHHFREIVGIDLLSGLQYPDNVQFELNYNGDSVGNASFSPDGTKIAALKRTESGFYYYGSLVVFDLTSNNQWIVNEDDDPHLTILWGSRPAWSPAGDKIAYYLHSRYDAASGTMKLEQDLFLIDPYTGEKIRLTNDEFNNTQPAWSPDGERIVFSSDRDGQASMDIWLMDKDGENLARLVDCTPASCYSPTFSPDGRQVAFSNGSRMFTISSDGDPSSLEEIANPGSYIGELFWSPFLVPPAFLDVQAEPRTITAGGTSILSWQSDRATEVYLHGIAEKQPPAGSIVVSPGTTTTYTLKAVGPTGSGETTVTVRVE